jgi:hypothetical protein
MVHSEGETSYDSFDWQPTIQRLHADAAHELLTHAKNDFCGPDQWPVARPKPQNALSQLAQVLLISNEFMFVD